MNGETVEWLLAGDPVIRWQTLRDVCGEADHVWQEERRRTTETGWGADYIAQMDSGGNWKAGRWTDTVWTLLLLMDCGLPADHAPLRNSAKRFFDRHCTAERAADHKWLMTRMDLCHLGFWLRIAAYFCENDERVAALADCILDAQMEDGGWNCRRRNYPKTHHGSFHTTFNVLEGLRTAADAGMLDVERFMAAERRAMEFMLQHSLYRSDKTGEVIDERFVQMTFPSHWHYTVMRGLDYVRRTPEIMDSRLNDPIDLVLSKQNARGRWTIEGRIPGVMFFDMEKPGAESRWNTMRIMRILRAKESAGRG